MLQRQQNTNDLQHLCERLKQVRVDIVLQLVRDHHADAPVHNLPHRLFSIPRSHELEDCPVYGKEAAEYAVHTAAESHAVHVQSVVAPQTVQVEHAELPTDRRDVHEGGDEQLARQQHPS